MGSSSGTNGFRCPIQVPWGPSTGPRPPDGPKKYNPTGPRFGRTSPTCALTPRIGLPERIPAPGCGIQLQGQFSHPWGTPGQGYDPHRGHLGLAEAPNLHTDAHRCTFRWDGVWCVPGLPRPFQRPKPGSQCRETPLMWLTCSGLHARADRGTLGRPPGRQACTGTEHMFGHAVLRTHAHAHAHTPSYAFGSRIHVLRAERLASGCRYSHRAARRRLVENAACAASGSRLSTLRSSTCSVFHEPASCCPVAITATRRKTLGS